MKKLLYGMTMIGALFMATDINAQETKKKGWSKKAKYTAVGTGAGVGTGVLVSKNDSKGAVIGGSIGAGIGYLYGRHKDKKNPGRRND